MAADEETQNPFTRPSFIAAAVVIALVVVLGVALAIINSTRSEPDPEPVPNSTTSAPSTTPTVSADGGASICKLGGESDEVPVSAPKALWEYQGTTAYPTSKTYGPGAENPAGFRFCFQHSPTGALFAAANAVSQGSDTGVSPAWLKYAVAAGPHRDEIVASVATGSGTEGSRMTIQGFRLLNYDGTTAQVDLALRGSSQGQTIVASVVYSLVWDGGDWKLSAETMRPIDIASLPDLSGYIAWGE